MRLPKATLKQSLNARGSNGSHCNPTSTRNKAVALTMLAALTLTACASATGADAEAGGGAGDAWQPSELQQLEGRIFGWNLEAMFNETQQEAQARAEADWRAGEERVAACMAEQGFTYIPFIDGGPIVTFYDDGGPDRESREFAELYGLGISTDAPFTGQSWRWDATTSPPDPNQELLEAMSDAERQAWGWAMSGGSTVENPAGCQIVRIPVRWGTGTIEDREFWQLEVELTLLWTRIERSPRIAELDAEWSSCMALAGFPDLRDRFSMHNDELWPAWQLVLNGPGWLERSNAWDWLAHPEGPDFPDPDPAAVAAFQAREIAMAVASYDCLAQVDYDARRSAISLEMQQEFIDANRHELEAWAQFAESHRQ